MNRISALLIFFIILSYQGLTQSLERVEPPFWWVGMNNTELQLLLYGKDISELTPVSSSMNIKVMAVHRMQSPNYLFIDLDIDENAQPGHFTIMLMRQSLSVLEFEYELKKREMTGEERKAFDASDVLYLITPDRFANGDPSNDEIAGMKEGLDRSKEYGRHGGDIQGIIDHLDYIYDMGFTAIWLNPLLENDQAQWSYHGYSTTDYCKVDPRFGSNEDYKRLCMEASEKGIGVIMDVIVNHCGSEHWWMKDLPGPDWINNSSGEYVQTNHRKTTLIDPYGSSRDRRLMTEGWFVPSMPDLNQNNPFMSTYLIQNSIWWIEYCGLYGLRQDTYSYPFRDFMTDWTCAINYEYPHMNIVGEEWTDNPSLISYWQEGKVNQDGYTSCLPSLMDFPLCMTLHNALNEDESFMTGLSRIYELLANDFQYADPYNLVIFPDNHDMSRVFTQLKEDTAHFKMAMIFYATTRGIPQIFYGTEILMNNKGTESHGVIRSDFPGGWPGDRHNAFAGQGMDSDIIDIQQWVSKLLNWRKTASAVHYGNLIHFNPATGVYSYFRYNKDQCVMVVMNGKDEDVDLDLDTYSEIIRPYASYKNVMADQEGLLKDGLSVKANSAMLLELRK